MNIQQAPNGWFRSRSRVVLLAFLAIAGFFLITEHTAHVLGILPWLLLLACPLIHLFHGSHRHRYGGHGEPEAHDAQHENVPDDGHDVGRDAGGVMGGGMLQMRGEMLKAIGDVIK